VKPIRFYHNHPRSIPSHKKNETGRTVLGAGVTQGPLPLKTNKDI
jgi:hypothetical protein